MTDRSRAEHLARALDAIGALTREFTASGRRPFPDRRLGRSHYDILFALSRSPRLSVGALATRLGVTSAAVSQLLDGLRSDGLVTVEIDADDRRRRVVRLTDPARVEVDDFQRAYVGDLAPRFDPLDGAELAELDRLLHRVRARDDGNDGDDGDDDKVRS